MKKKVLIIVTRGEIGGAQQFVLTLARGIKKEGWDIIVGCGDDGYLKEEICKENISFRLFKNLGRTHNPFKNLGFIIELYNFCKKEQIDIVHLNSSNALVGAVGAKLANKKAVATLHGLSFLDPNHTNSSWLRFSYKIIFSFLLTFIDQIIFVSKYNFAYAAKIGMAKKGRLIYNGIDAENTASYSRDGARKIFSQKTGVDFGNSFVIGSIGRYAYPKNYEFIIKNFKEVQCLIPTAKLLLVGEGPDRRTYENLIQRLQLENDVFLLGEMLPGSAYLKGFDLFILPSIYEGIPLSILEATQANVPVVASKVGGIPEIVDEKYCFSPDSKGELLHALAQRISSREKTQKNTIDFSAATMVAEYTKLYESVS